MYPKKKSFESYVKLYMNYCILLVGYTYLHTLIISRYVSIQAIGQLGAIGLYSVRKRHIVFIYIF